MKYTTMIKNKLVDPALERGEVETLQQTSTIWKVVAEAEKLELDIAQLRSKTRSESMRFWVPIIAPLIGAAGIIATLIFQINQFNENTKLARQTAEDAAWREVVKGVSTAVENPLQGLFSMAQMKGFLDSERYSQAAREISVEFLGRTFDPYAFKAIFPDIAERTGWENFNDLTRLNSSLNRFFQFVSRLEGKPNMKLPKDEAGRPRDPSAIKEAIGEEMIIVTNYIVNFLREQTATRPADRILDFNGVQFSEIDLSKIDFSRSNLNNTIFHQSNLSNTIFSKCTVVGSEFIEISNCAGSSWEETAWWRALKMDRGLLGYLEATFPYKKGIKYYNDSTKDVKEYLADVARLKVN